MEDQHTNGGYSSDHAIWHAYSPFLMREILRIFPKEKQIFDLGCGLNNYVSILNILGFKAWGYDSLDLGSKYFTKCNLAYPMPPVKANVISFEVGEHIPQEFESQFLDNLCNFGGNVLMSWAIPGQAGIGHINCRTNEWVIQQMEARGYRINWKETDQVRQALEFCHCNWFRNTIMFFEPKN
jgi:hypothetical protein